jgi:hypothetical protein
MRLFATGLDGDTDAALYPSFDEEAFQEVIETTYAAQTEELRVLKERGLRSTQFRGEIERRSLPDQGEPRVVGWTYLIAKGDPDANAIAEILEPLARHRGMRDPRVPLIYDGTSSWWEWLDEHYFGPGMERGMPPHYVLIVGEATRVPFHFQCVLDSIAAVGRVCFDSLRELGQYVHKVIDIESATTPVTRRESVFWAPNGGPTDATFYSHLYMAKPLAEEVGRQGFQVHELFGDKATKGALLDALSTGGAALAYTASHGLAPPSKSFESQKRLAGALCGQHARGEERSKWLLTADDLPESTPFLEGGIFFQFACYGYGVPARSDFAHWVADNAAKREPVVREDFVSAIPRRLLANPRGPVAFIGHVDTAWLHGFTDPYDTEVIDRWSPRLAPFKRAIELLLAVQPAGIAMNDFNKQYAIGNAILASYLDRMQRNMVKKSRETRRHLVDQVIRRSDAQNYMVFGDPAARVRISDA